MLIKKFLFIFFLMTILSCSREKEQINALFMAQAGYQPEDLKSIVKIFEEISDIKVNLNFVKYDDQYNKIVENFSPGKKSIDVISMDLIWTAEFVKKEYCLDLTSNVSKFKKKISPAVIDAFEYDNKIWAMPYLANFQLLYYNSEIINKAGFLKPPSTLEELYEQMKTIKRRGILKFPWVDSWNQKEGLVCEFVWLTAAFGGKVFNEKNVPVFNNIYGKRALNYMIKLLREGLANPISLTSDEIISKDIFISGKAAFTSNWTFMYKIMNDPSFSKIVGKGKISLLPVSTSIKKNYKTVSVSGFQGLSILSNSSHKKSSWKFISFLSSPLVQRAYLQEVPIWHEVQNDPFINKLDNMMDIKSVQMASVRHRPKHPDYTEVSSILQYYIHKALRGEMKTGVALSQAEKKIKQLH